MSTYFSANQYDDAFYSHKIGNWEYPKHFKRTTWFNDHYEAARPRRLAGFTDCIVNDRGHLCKAQTKACTNPWGNFVGTWDLPRKIPGNRLDLTTGRNIPQLDIDRRNADEAYKVLSGQVKNETRRGAPRRHRSCVPPVMPSCEFSPCMFDEGNRSGAEAPPPVTCSPMPVVASPCECRSSTFPILPDVLSPVLLESPPCDGQEATAVDSGTLTAL